MYVFIKGNWEAIFQVMDDFYSSDFTSHNNTSHNNTSDEGWWSGDNASYNNTSHNRRQRRVVIEGSNDEGCWRRVVTKDGD